MHRVTSHPRRPCPRPPRGLRDLPGTALGAMKSCGRCTPPVTTAFYPSYPSIARSVERHRVAMSRPSIATVLDVGAGTGSVTVPLARQGTRVTAVDVHRAMLDRLAAKLHPPERTRVTLVEDTAECLSHAEDGGFDGVTALLSFFAMDDPMSALREAERVLKRGGTLIVTEPRRGFDVAPLMAEAERVLRARGLLDRLHRDWARFPRVWRRTSRAQSPGSRDGQPTEGTGYAGMRRPSSMSSGATASVS